MARSWVSGPDHFEPGARMGQAAPVPAPDRDFRTGPARLIGAAIAGALVIGLVASPLAARSPDDVRREADQLVVTGIEQFRQGRSHETFRLWHEALRLYGSIGDRQRQGVVLQNLGVATRRLGRHEAARDYFARSLEIARERGDRALERDLAEELAQTYRSLGDSPQALAAYEAVLAGARAAGDQAAERRALGSLGLLHADAGDAERGLEYLRTALDLARRTRHRHDEGAALWNMGDVQLDRGRYEDALHAFWQAGLIARELGDTRREAAALGKLGTCQYFLGDYPRAENHFRQSLELARASGDLRAQSDAWRGLGSVAYGQGRLDAAIAAYEKDLEIARRLADRVREGKALGNLGLAYTARGEHGKAIEHIERDLAIARERGDRQAEGQALTNLGTAHHHRGDYARAAEQYRQGLAAARAIGYRRGEGIALTNLGYALLKGGRLDAAEDALREALTVLDGIRERAGRSDAHQVSLFETHLRTYRFLQVALVARGRPEAALEVAERGRARALAELLAGRATPGAETRAPAVPPPSLAQIRDAARTRQAVLVEYSAVPEEHQLFIWVVSPDGQVRFRRVDLAGPGRGWSTLDDLVARTRRSLGVRGRGAARPPSGPEDERWRKALYEILIAPIAADLPSDSDVPIILVPQGPLFLVPFAALMDASGRDLIERHTLLVTPSIQTLELSRTRRARAREVSRGAVVVGNPVMPSLPARPGEVAQRLAPLPGAEREATTVAGLLGTQPLVGADATKPAVISRMRGARWVHLATHGLLDDTKGLGVPGAIALAPSPGDDGILTAPEILDLNLSAELVVLSACDTGRGRLSGDGVIGLSRAVVAAGAASVIVSLWPVPDVRTAELMTTLYQQLQQDPNRARALRQAALETRRRDADPIAWAGFVLVGEAR